MAEITIDFNNVANENLIPEGEYEVKVDQVEQKQGRESGATYLNWQFRITDGRHAGRCLFMKTSVQPEALWRLQDLFAAIGMSNIGKVTIDLDQLAGRRLFVTVDRREYDGRIQEEIKGFRACE